MTLQILIVDADASAAAATSAFVKHLVPSAAVTCEPSPGRGWSAAQRTPPDLLIVDPGAPGSSGTLLIKLCKENWPGMHIIALASERLSPSQIQQCAADAFVEKPSSPALLHEVLLRAFRQVLANLAQLTPVAP